MRGGAHGFVLYDSLLAMLALSVGLSSVAMWMLQEGRFVTEGRRQTKALWAGSNALESWSPPPLNQALPHSCTQQCGSKITTVPTWHASTIDRPAYGQVCSCWTERGQRHLLSLLAPPP